jgi:predicted aldo/keto reductase-like oxidoreductase
LRWVWNHPEVSVVLSGMSNMDHVVENVAVAQDATAGALSPLEMETVERVADTYRRKFKVDCTGCGYCLPCPNGVNIPWIFSLYNDQFMFESREMGTLIYSAMMPADQRVDNCVECGECKEKCPQQIEIIENLKQAHQLLYRDLASL